MNLELAFDHLNREYLRCAEHDVHTAAMRSALRTILTTFPQAKAELVAYWGATQFEADLARPRWVAKVQTCVPILHRLDRHCGRRWTVKGYAWETDFAGAGERNAAESIALGRQGE